MAWPELQRHENRQPLGLRPRSGHVQSSRSAPLMATASVTRSAPVRHCSRRQRDQSYCLRAAPLSTSCARPSEPEMQEGWCSCLALGGHGQRRILPSRPRHDRVRRGVLANAVGPPSARGAGARARDGSLWSRRAKPGLMRSTTARRAGLVPARAPKNAILFSTATSR